MNGPLLLSASGSPPWLPLLLQSSLEVPLIRGGAGEQNGRVDRWMAGRLGSDSPLWQVVDEKSLPNSAALGWAGLARALVDPGHWTAAARGGRGGGGGREVPYFTRSIKGFAVPSE